ncbi:MAG: mechanosensitive ion channel family protein [Marinilabiliales bacterium]|nr:MAG: mechanosensitive ion channel family protein [Marinilabiliales bacterium]
MEEFFNKEFYGNTVLDWVIAFAIIIGSILLAKVIFFLIGRFVKQITKRTKNKFDDILVDKFEEPAVFAIIILGIWYGLTTLTLDEENLKLIKHAYYLLITFNAAWFVTRFMDSMIEEYLVPLVEKTETDLDDQLMPIARKSIKTGIWVLAIVVGLNNAGYDVAALIAGLGLGGLAFALAAKDSVSHLFGGFVLFTDKPFKIKDRIITNGLEGFVTEIGIRSSRIRTLDGRLVTIPNADIANNTIVNVSSEPSRKITLNLGLTYDTPVEKMEEAMKVLKQITADNVDVIEDITSTSFTAFNDFSLNIRFVYYIRKGSGIYETMNNINMEILKRFNANKLEFAFPTQTIYSKSE